jgi:hypothetical protein
MDFKMLIERIIKQRFLIILTFYQHLLCLHEIYCNKIIDCLLELNKIVL